MVALARQLRHPAKIALLLPFLAVSFAPQTAAAGGPYQVFTVEPCRVLDTRLGSGDDFGGAPHALAPDESMSIDVTEGFIAGQGGEADCGIPFPEAKGVFVNVAAVPVSGFFNNHLKAYPFGSPEPNAAILNYDPGSFAISNAVFVALCDLGAAPPGGCGDDLTLTNGPSATTDVVIDVMGYVRSVP
jgi:hypothetical protein